MNTLRNVTYTNGKTAEIDMKDAVYLKNPQQIRHYLRKRKIASVAAPPPPKSDEEGFSPEVKVEVVPEPTGDMSDRVYLIQPWGQYELLRYKEQHWFYQKLERLISGSAPRTENDE